MMAWLDDVKVRCTRLSLRLQVAGQMKLVSGTLKTWKVVPGRRIIPRKAFTRQVG